ncbi:MAG: hypothetical protein VB018_06225 [Lachnospiraceae bacterium]|nr:hypothetical protein [Lachnospiraceae bacterium]
MCTILLSINPEHVENILNGKKEYEFRKTLCKKKVDRILIYSTNPIMKIVGEAKVEDILVDNPRTIWKITNEKSGINKQYFDQYYKDRERAVAYKLCDIVQYSNPKNLQDFGLKNAPQSFLYVES